MCCTSVFGCFRQLCKWLYLVMHKHDDMKYMKIHLHLNNMNYNPPKTCSHLRIIPSAWYLVQKLIRHADNKEKIFARCWKFMVTLLCPNNSRSVSRADSLCRKQSHIWRKILHSACLKWPISTLVSVWICFVLAIKSFHYMHFQKCRLYKYVILILPTTRMKRLLNYIFSYLFQIDNLGFSKL